MATRKLRLQMSQAFMVEAVEYYLRNVVIAKNLKVAGVEVDAPDRKINQTDHFVVNIDFPEDKQSEEEKTNV